MEERSAAWRKRRAVLSEVPAGMWMPWVRFFACRDLVCWVGRVVFVPASAEFGGSFADCFLDAAGDVSEGCAETGGSSSGSYWSSGCGVEPRWVVGRCAACLVGGVGAGLGAWVSRRSGRGAGGALSG